MSISRMKFFTLKNLFEFLPITIFLICVRIFDSRVTHDWKYPMLMGGTVALVLFIYYLYFRLKQNRIAFGINCYLLTGTAAFIFKLEWLGNIYQKMEVTAIFGWIIIICVFDLIFSQRFISFKPLGFKIKEIKYSFFFLLGVCAAFGMSLLFHNDRIFSEFIPFTFLFISDRFLEHHNYREKKKRNMDFAK